MKIVQTGKSLEKVFGRNLPNRVSGPIGTGFRVTWAGFARLGNATRLYWERDGSALYRLLYLKVGHRLGICWWDVVGKRSVWEECDCFGAEVGQDVATIMKDLTYINYSRPLNINSISMLNDSRYFTVLYLSQCLTNFINYIWTISNKLFYITTAYFAQYPKYFKKKNHQRKLTWSEKIINQLNINVHLNQSIMKYYYLGWLND